jgi:hypothetical protein
MSLSTIKREVSLMLNQADHRLAEAEAKLEAGKDQEKVTAAGEIAFLRRQKDDLQARLAEIDAHSQAPEALFQWLREEVFNLTERLDDWVAHR